MKGGRNVGRAKRLEGTEAWVPLNLTLIGLAWLRQMHPWRLIPSMGGAGISSMYCVFISKPEPWQPPAVVEFHSPCTTERCQSLKWITEGRPYAYILYTGNVTCSIVPALDIEHSI